jgi:Fic-DOC domain mobile mystery protein B
VGRVKAGRRREPDHSTPFDASGLKLKHLRTKRELNVAEARNISRAITKYLASAPSKRKAPFTLDWSYILHREMFCDVWRWAGRPRNSETNVGGPSYQIAPSLKDLFDDLATWSRHESYPLEEQAVRLHHGAVAIHPFNNGNGRWARMLANIWLRQHKAAIVRWPDNSFGREGEIRKEYIDAIKDADRGDLAPLLKLHREYSF